MKQNHVSNSPASLSNPAKMVITAGDRGNLQIETRSETIETVAVSYLLGMRNGKHLNGWKGKMSGKFCLDNANGGLNKPLLFHVSPHGGSADSQQVGGLLAITVALFQSMPDGLSIKGWLAPGRWSVDATQLRAGGISSSNSGK